MTTLAIDPIEIGIIVVALVVGFIQFIREKIASARAEAEMREEIRRRGQQRSASGNAPRGEQPLPPAARPTPEPPPQEGLLEQLKRTLAEGSRPATSPLPSPGTPPRGRKTVARSNRPPPPQMAPPPVTADSALPKRPPSPPVTAPSSSSISLAEDAAYRVDVAPGGDSYLMDGANRKAKRPSAASAERKAASAQLFRQFLSNPAALRTTFLAKEIFGPPKGLQDE